RPAQRPVSARYPDASRESHSALPGAADSDYGTGVWPSGSWPDSGSSSRGYVVVRQEHGTGVWPEAWDRAGPGSALALARDYGLVVRRSSWWPGRQWHGTTPGCRAGREGHLVGRAPCWAAAGSPGRQGFARRAERREPLRSWRFWGRLCCPAGKMAWLGCPL